MNILLLDLETTGLKPEEHEIIEVGAAIYNTELKEVLWQYGTLIYTPRENSAKHINRISQESINLLEGYKEFLDPISEILKHIDVKVVLAHNAKFDEGFVRAKWGVLANPKTKQPIPWRCSKADIEYPSQGSSKALRYLAVDHEVVVPPDLHRALSDVMLMVEVLKKVPNLEEQIEIALGPRTLFKAEVPFQRKDEAKSRGFSWNPGNKRWEKVMPADTPLAPTEDRPFRLTFIKEV